jgi:hypothetical protein
VSDPDLAKYRFFSWFRAGAAAAITAPDGPSLPARAQIGVDLSIDDGHGAHVDVALLGPGDVRSLDARAVARTVPPAGTASFEPGHLPAIELRRADLPWAMTPARAGDHDRLRPWICLVAVRRQDGVSLDLDPKRNAHVLTIQGPASPSDELPDLAESWAWAHAQIVGSAGASLRDVSAQSPERALARLLCPTPLRPASRYLACVVPTFAIGRKAGVGEPITDADWSKLDPAWVRGPDLKSIKLPVYFFWEFATGEQGDFASLARALTPRALPKTVGVRTMILDDVGFGISSETPIEMPGVLRAPGATPAEWPANEEMMFKDALAGVLNWPADEGALLAPPTYGRWLAGARVSTDGSAPAWLVDLNLDPRMRAFAGAGARVIEKQQEALIAEVWAQLGDARRANRIHNLGQLTRGALRTIVERRLGRMSRDDLLPVTAPLHHRARIEETRVEDPSTKRQVTLGDALSRSNGADAVSPAFRRAVRPRGPLARRAAPGGARTTFAFLSRLVPTQTLKQLPPHGGHPPPPPIMVFDPPPDRWLFTDTTVPGVPVPIGWPAREDDRIAWPPEQDWPADEAGDDRPAPVRDFLKNARPTPEPPPPEWSAPSYDHLTASLGTGLAVDETVVKSIAARIASDTSPATNGDPLEPILFAPTLDRPMFDGLRDESRDLVLPGMDGVPGDTIAVVEVNPAAIEAYMVGVNHAFNRALRWREVPADARDTPLRTFWDSRGRVPPPADAEAARDIPPIHGWSPASRLGQHLRGQLGGVVLLVRGRLLQRYPDTIVYAVEAVRTPTGRAMGTNEKYPLYRATIDPDITVLGFDLTRAAARGSPTPPGHPGWFFVLQQRPTAPEFALGGAAKPADQIGPDAATIARVTLLNPVRYVVHAADVIPKEA